MATNKTETNTSEALLTVSDVARLAGVSVRALHHYDEIGLLSPSARSEAGYRLYDRQDLERLQEVLLFRELEIPLDDIAVLLAGGALDRRSALELQREMLAKKAVRTQALIASVDRAINAERTGVRMTKEEMFEVFGDFDPAEYEEEVQERWGETDAYKESAKRTSRYTKADWERFKAEQEEMGARMIALFDAGVPAEDPRSMDVAEEARLQIDKWFYPLSREMHVCLGEMYVADPRFKANYDKMREGLAQWLCDAIKANAAREA